MAKIQISINDDLLERVDVYAKKKLSFSKRFFSISFKSVFESARDGICIEGYECGI